MPPVGADGRTAADFRCLFDHHPSAVLLLDAQGRIIEANRALRTRFGHEPAALRGQLLSALLPDWDPPGLLADLMQQCRPLDAVLRHAQGLRREVVVSLLPAGAHADGGCFLIARDVTAQRRLQRQAQVQADILARTHDAVVVLDVLGEVVCWNAAAARLYGAPAQAMAGRPFALLFEDPARTRLLQGLAEARVDAAAPIELALRRTGVDGVDAVLRLSLSRLSGVEPGTELCLVQGLDVTAPQGLDARDRAEPVPQPVEQRH